ncbi:MFS general substrate transporter [Acaromyces ingoldii]|uniref:MFS general substrate transporter n=1 Tax=Acaromyces ingoldii TaxID=215250 RepID=A0A316YSU6_9BASI|nr:MFS general substrate transporter [Acaromyces ingoldii]PWN91093.1 MFS general substrate transporter [Acaromyces ingoldii]
MSAITVFWSGIALLSDGYNAQALSSVNVILSKQFPQDFTSVYRTRLSTAYYVGTCLGALFFGGFIDRLSRKAGAVTSTLLMVLGVILCTAANGTSPQGLFWMLIVARGVTGVGAGGEYPISTTMATESSDETSRLRRMRGLLVGLVGCTAIDAGFVVAGITPLIVLAAYGYTSTTPVSETHGLNGVWRIVFGLGIVVPLSILYLRLKLVTSTAFARHGSPQHLSSPRFWLVVVRTYWRRIVGTCLCWALYDAVSYPFGLFTSTIIDQLSGGQSTLIRSIGYGTVINLFYIPGCLVGSFAMDRLGRRNTQATFFLVQAVVAFVLGGALGPISSIFPLFVVLYGLVLALGEAGPGVATILISAESYPTMIRGQMVGLSAAFGKAGAAVGTVAFGAIQDRLGEGNAGTQGVFLCGAAFSVVGGLLTLACIPVMTDKLQDEDERFEAILAANGITLDLPHLAPTAAMATDLAATRSIDKDEKDAAAFVTLS